jgi:group II intron reverse transcriptase/maturase
VGKAKPFDIPKRVVWEAYQRVRANRGAAGVDDQSIEAFDRAVKNNLFKLWNRLSSGSYFPPPVKRVAIKKRQGGSRPLGIPTVSDRIAQGVVKAYLEPELEGHFHPDSYGYRPGKSALEGVGMARQRCWRHDWVLDLDIQAFFDTIPHDLLLRAVRKHTECTWVLLYIERWLTAPVQLENGALEPRESNCEVGGSPVLGRAQGWRCAPPPPAAAALTPSAPRAFLASMRSARCAARRPRECGRSAPSSSICRWCQ